MALLPVATCAQLLGIHPKTLHCWLKEANVPLATHPSDARIKCLQESHLQEIARRHDRSLPPLDSVLVSLPERSAPRPPSTPCEPDLMQKLSGLEIKVATLQEQLSGLALALLAERERTLERRVVALETFTDQALGRRPLPLPEGLMADPASSPAVVPQGSRTPHPAERGPRARLIPLIEYGACGTYVIICPDAGELTLVPDSTQWFEWLACLSSFRFVGQSGRFTAGRGSKHHRPTRSWRAVRSLGNRNYKYHLGVTEHLTVARLEQAAATLQAHMTSL